MMSMRSTSKRLAKGSDRGAALVEFAVVLPLLLALLLGLAEFGLAFRDWLTINSASRSGARVGTAAGQNAAADILVLQAIEAALGSSTFDDVTAVVIYQSNEDGDPIPGQQNRYRPNAGACGWAPCPDPAVGPTYGGPWVPSVRQVTVAPGTPLDVMGVRIEFTHQWVTGFLGFSDANWEDTAVMRMEPQQFAP